MPPKVGARSLTVWMISSGSLVARQIGKASTCANSLKSIALPSITGIAASGPMSPRPSTAEPSETTATVFALIVKSKALVLSSAMYSQTRATPGVYAIERSSRVFSGYLLCCSILPFLCISKVRSVKPRTRAPRVEPIERRICSQASALAASIVNSRTLLPSGPAPGMRSTDWSAPPASAIWAVILPSGSWRASSSTRTVTLY